MEYQRSYFDDKFILKKIENLNSIEILKDKLKIYEMGVVDE